ncbi:MAG TPA: S4 domain-containing protein [Gemmatimonadales bacterium]|nr:S4 domain-containing protein [Gemmatimonadales bacterium]
MTDDAVRLDSWLWAARFFKTRSQAAAAIAGGKVHVNGVRAKPAKAVTPGDAVRVRKGPFEFDVRVRGLALRRGPARDAQALYDETPASLAARERLALQLKLQPAPAYTGTGRPTKKDRRTLDRFREES